jgi:hypothetical protein
MKRSTLAVALLLCGACYSYQPAMTGVAPKLGERVVLDLTPQGSVEMARYLGPSVTIAEGGLVSVGPDGELTVAVDFVQMSNGMKQPWAGEGSVIFPRQYVQTLRERHFERRRTVVASTAAIAALIAAEDARLFHGNDGGGGTPPPP